jgi:RimJ/RimL family protein N-acetyltransferase
MITEWFDPPGGKCAEIAAAVSALVPCMTTARLSLRAPALTDYPDYQTVFLSHRSGFIGGPFTEVEAYADFCQGVAGWILRGAGMWTVTLRDQEAPVGWIYLWQEMGDPEPELGWVLVEAAEGKGYALEAARAVLSHAVALFGEGGFVSYIAAGQTRSARIATAIGAKRDPDAEAALGTGMHVYRYFSTGAPA